MLVCRHVRTYWWSGRLAHFGFTLDSGRLAFWGDPFGWFDGLEGWFASMVCYFRLCLCLVFGQLAVEALCLYSSIIVEAAVLVVIISYVTLSRRWPQPACF